MVVRKHPPIEFKKVIRYAFRRKCPECGMWAVFPTFRMYEYVCRYCNIVFYGLEKGAKDEKWTDEL